MKTKSAVVAVLVCAVPALATVNLGVNDLGNGVFAVTYNTGGAAVRAFALDINVSAGATVTAISGYKTGESKTGSLGYGIFPASFRDHITNPADPCWSDPNYNPVAPGTDSGALGGLGTAGITVELGSLYVMGGPNAPPSSGTLCNVTISGTGTIAVCVAANTTRGGVVLEDANAASTNLPVCGPLCISCGDAPCWGCATQCHGDCDCDGRVDIDDFYCFKDAFGKSYPDPLYNPCADFNRDGAVNIDDFYVFKDGFILINVPGDCIPGGTWPPF